MKVNWKVRFKNRQFLVSLIALLVVLSNQVAAVFGADITVYSTQFTEVSETILTILALMGIIVDPTTPGASDSSRAMTYGKK